MRLCGPLRPFALALAVIGAVAAAAASDSFPRLASEPLPFVLSAPQPAATPRGASDLFGFSIALRDDIALIGAPNAYAGEGLDLTRTGRAFLYDLSKRQLLHILESPSGEPDDFFGRRVLLNAAHAVVLGKQRGATDQGDGALYVFDIETGALLHEISPTGSGPENITGPFYTSALTEDALIIGRAGVDDPLPNSGAVEIFDLATLELRRRVLNPNPRAEDYFGNVLAARGGKLLVSAGSQSEYAPYIDPGQAYLIDMDSSAVLQSFENPDDWGGHTEFGREILLQEDSALFSMTPADPAFRAQAVQIDIETGEVTTIFRESQRLRGGDSFSAMAFSGDLVFLSRAGPRGYSIAQDGSIDPAQFADRYIQIHDRQTGALLRRLVPHDPDLAYHSFGERLVATDDWLLIGMPGLPGKTRDPEALGGRSQAGQVLVFSRPSERTDWGPWAE